ncbi:hypothetical protein AYJ56_10545 [Brucella anthropi]|jgi:hypothetical protein|nr:hypothetical protein AYJ56_10545 [Brucella anthropi]
MPGILFQSRSHRKALIRAVNEAAHSVASNIIAMSIVVRFSVRVELGCSIYTLGVIGPVDGASDSVTTIVVVGIAMITRCMMVLLLVVS